MAHIPEDAVTFLDEGRLAYVATTSGAGEPNCVPKGSMGVLDDEHLVFADLYEGTTMRNLQANGRIAVTIVNPAAYRGYQFKGTATLIPPGGDFDAIAARVQRGQLNFNRAKYAVKVHVEEVVEMSQ